MRDLVSTIAERPHGAFPVNMSCSSCTHSHYNLVQRLHIAALFSLFRSHYHNLMANCSAIVHPIICLIFPIHQ